GTKHLYYSFDDKQLTWSTILDPLVLFAGRTFEICEEYIAGWFAIPVFPVAHLTPYVGSHSVPPSSSVLLRPGKHIVSKDWDFDPGKRIRYRTDAEYEEHFRSALATAVQRHLRSDRPVLAELSGGMDSCSIVCMADLVIARSVAMPFPRQYILVRRFLRPPRTRLQRTPLDLQSRRKTRQNRIPHQFP